MAKDQAYYQKLAISGQWKKMNKVLAGDNEQAKLWCIEALGQAAVRSDAHYNQLVDVFQNAADKSAKLAAIKAMGNSGRAAAASQMEYAAQHTQDPEILEALNAARHALKSGAK